MTDNPITTCTAWDVLSLIVTSLNFVIGLHFICKSLTTSKRDKLVKLCVFTHLLFTFSGLSIILYFILFMDAIYVVAEFFYMAGLTVMNGLYFLRVHRRFDKTQFALSKPISILFIILFIVQILSSFFKTCAFFYFEARNYKINPSFIGYIIFQGTMSLSAILILYAFSQRIIILGDELINKAIKYHVNHENSNHRKLDLQQQKVNLKEERKTERTKTIKSLNSISSTTKTLKRKKKKPKKRQKTVKNKLLAKTARNTVCAFTSFVSSIFVNIMGLFYNNHTTLGFFICLMVLNQTTNMICLYLQHRYSTICYKRCCWKQHQCLYWLFVKKKEKNEVIGSHFDDDEYTTNVPYNTDTSTEATSSTPNGRPVLHRGITKKEFGSNTFDMIQSQS